MNGSNKHKQPQERTNLSQFHLYYEELPSSDKPTTRNGGISSSAPRQK